MLAARSARGAVCLAALLLGSACPPPMNRQRPGSLPDQGRRDALPADAGQRGDRPAASDLRATEGGPQDVPAQASAVGYLSRTFHSSFAAGTIDLKNTAAPGQAWYLRQFFGKAPTDPAKLTFNPDGSLTLDNGATLNTAAPAQVGWTGTAFGGGGYFEAVLKFDPMDVMKGTANAPVFWSLSIEHFAGLPGEQWPGQPPGYVHYVNLDFFKYNIWSTAPAHHYAGAFYELWGIRNQTCPVECVVSNLPGGGTSFSSYQVQTPPATDYTSYHRFGLLWVPATASSPGYVHHYFDDQPTNNKVSWTRYTGQPPPPGSAPWTFGIIDQQHLVVLLGTGQSQPMTVSSVSIWQRSAAGNLQQ